MTKPSLFAVGAAHMDRRGRVSGPYVPAASNPGTMREEVGGGAFNALRNAVRHGVAGTVFSLRGGDLAGETVARAIARWHILDRSAIFLDRTTPSYTALLDEHGELIAGFADMALYEAGFGRQIRRRTVRDTVRDADAVICDANMPADSLAALVRMADDKPVFAIAISPAKVVRFSESLAHVECLFMNLREARVLAGLDGQAPATQAAKALYARGLRRGVITSGSAALIGFDGDARFMLKPPLARGVADVTGAGDALAGTAVAHLMAGKTFAEAIRHGMAASLLTVENAAVVAEYGDDAFATALTLVGEATPVA